MVALFHPYLCSDCVLLLVPPSVIIKPTDQMIMENEEVMFHCIATGNPTPEITWFKDGKTMGRGDTLIFKAKSDKSGKYWCSADNGLDITVNTSAFLDVQCKYNNSILPD